MAGLRSFNPASSWAENVTIYRNGSTLRVCLTPLVVGTYDVEFLAEAPVAAPLMGSPLRVSIVPGPLDPASCIVSGATAGGLPGYALNITVVARDAFGNLRSGSLGDAFFLRLDALDDPPDILSLADSSFVMLVSESFLSAVHHASYSFNRTGSSGTVHLSVLARSINPSAVLQHVSGSPFTVFRGTSAFPAAAAMYVDGVRDANPPAFGPDAMSVVVIQLLQSNGSAYLHPSSLLSAFIAPHSDDASLFYNVPAAYAALAGTATHLTYRGLGSYELSYGCAVELTGACASGDLVNVVVALDGIRAALSTQGSGADTTLSVSGAPSHATGVSLAINSTLLVVGRTIVVEATELTSYGSVTQVVSNSTPRVISWSGESLDTLVERTGVGFTFVPHINGPHIVCVAVLVELDNADPVGQTSARYSCMQPNATNFTLVRDTSVSYITSIAVEGGLEVVARHPFTLWVTLSDPAHVFPVHPSIDVALWRLCNAAPAWTCALMPALDLLCSVANVSVQSPFTLDAGIFEFEAVFDAGATNETGCHWVSQRRLC